MTSDPHTTPSHDPDHIVVSQSRLQVFAWGLVSCALLGILLAGYFGWSLWHKNTLDGAQKTTLGNKETERDRLVKEIGALMALPSSVPTVATVNDPNLLRSQPFFAHATAGDKVLIYSKERKTILYNPVEKKIIEVGYMDSVAPTP